jgi:hypothetical protein
MGKELSLQLTLVESGKSASAKPLTYLSSYLLRKGFDLHCFAEDVRGVE